MSIIKEFKEFAMKGNVVDLAVAVVSRWTPRPATCSKGSETF
jgi:Large-conductance mechanosensitive channel, MscL